MTKMDERIRDHRRRSAGWAVGPAAACLALLMVVPAISRAEGSGASGLRLPNDFQPPAKECRREGPCNVQLRTEGGGLLWHMQCGQAPDADAAQRLTTLRQRQQDILVIVVAPSKKAWHPKILDYLDEQRMSLLMDEGRIRVVRVEGKRAADNQKKLEEFCAQPISADGLAVVPNTGFVFVGEKAEAPTKNPCRDDRWNDGVPLMSNLDDISDLIGEKASSIVLTQRQLRDMESHQRRFCEESGDASAFVEVVVPDPGVAPRGGRAERALGARDLGVADANVRTQLERLGIRIETRNLARLKQGDLRSKAKPASDGNWTISLASLRDLVGIANERAARYDAAEERKALFARILAVHRSVDALNREFSGATSGKELTAQGIQGRVVTAREKYTRLCGSSVQLDCDRISVLLIEVNRGLDELDRVQSQGNRPFQTQAAPRAGQGGAAQDAQDWIERTLRQVEALREKANRCKEPDCMETVTQEVTGVELAVEQREPSIREVARAAAGDSESARLLRLNSVLVRAENALADLGGPSEKWSTMKIAGVATLVGGGLLALGGIVPLVLANNDSKWLDDARAQGVPAGCVLQSGAYVKANCSLMADITDRIDRQRLRAIVGYAVMGAGVAAIIAGTTVLVVDHNKSAGGRPQVSVSPAHQGAVVGISGTF